MLIGLGLIGQLCFGVMSQDSLFQNDGRVFVRRVHEAYRNSCVVPTVKLGGGGVIVGCNVVQKNGEYETAHVRLAITLP